MAAVKRDEPTPGAPAGLHVFALLLTGATFLLILAGGLVTSHDAGLSVPDWPTSYGWSMFTFPVSKWVGNIRYEHIHRLMASTVGFLTILLFLALLRWGRSRALKVLGAVALGTVVLQGILGGLTVIYLLPTPISVAHACLAQTFFCVVASIAVVASPLWQAEDRRVVVDGRRPSLRILCLATFAAVYVQLILGAVMRHTGSGLAIPDVPLAFGRLLPPIGSYHVAIAFAHRVWALVVAGLIFWTWARIVRVHASDAALRRPAWLLVVMVLGQVLLGMATVASRKAPLIATAHVGLGALVLVTAFVLTLRAYRRTAGAQKARAVCPVGSVAEAMS
jgi:heme a synthase